MHGETIKKINLEFLFVCYVFCVVAKFYLFFRSDFHLQWTANILINNNITVILFIKNYRERQGFTLPRTEFFTVFSSFA